MQISEAESTIATQGWLLKEGSLIKNWKKRYFILWKNCTLGYHQDQCPSSEFNSSIKGVLDLRNAEITCKSFSSSKVYGIQIVTLDRVLNICADSEETRQEWRESILSTVNKNVPVLTRHHSTQSSMPVAKQGTIKQGWARKQGQVVKSWKRRYFKLWSNGTLTYYESEPNAPMSRNSAPVTGMVDPSSTPKGAIAIRGSFVGTLPDLPRQFNFFIQSEQRTILISVDSSEERSDWVDSLLQAGGVIGEPLDCSNRFSAENQGIP